MSLKHLLPAMLLVVALGCNGAAMKKSQQEQARLRYDRTRALVQLSLAKQQFDIGNIAGARKSADTAEKLDPTIAIVHVMSAKVSIEQGVLDRAEKSLKRARELDPKNAEADYLSGVVCQRWQKTAEALAFYTAAAQKAPTELSYLLAQAETLVVLDQRGQALQILEEKLSYFESSAAIRDAVGQLLAQTGNYKVAARLLKQATILAPEEFGIREHLALALYADKNFHDAEIEFSRLTKDARYKTRGDILAALGECQMQLGKHNDARDNFDLATKVAPALVGNWLNLGKAGLAVNDLRRAELALRKAVSLDNRHAEAHLLMGYLRLKQGKLDNAFTSFRQASALDPRDATSLCMIGFVLEKKGRPNEAITYYAKALKLKPNDELATTLMAQVQANE